MNLEAIVKRAKKADACPYNIAATVAYGEAVALLRPEVLLALVLAAQRYAFCREAGAWESEVVLDTLAPEEFDARVDQEMAARAAETAAQKPATTPTATPESDLFEFWRTDHMPHASQGEALAEWCALGMNSNQDDVLKQAPSGTAPIRDRLRHALLDGGVVLDQKRLVLIFDPRQPGENILQQVLNRLGSCWPTPLPDEQRRQMVGECGDDYEKRGIFASGWLGAEHAYGISTACRSTTNSQEQPKTAGGTST